MADLSMAAGMAQHEAQQCGQAVALLQAAQAQLQAVPKLAASFESAQPPTLAASRRYFDDDLAAFIDSNLKKVGHQKLSEALAW